MNIEILKSIYLRSLDPVREASSFDTPYTAPCDYDLPHNIKLATKRGNQTRKWFGGGWGQIVLISK